MGFSTTHLILLLAAVVLLFGRGKISELMGDLAKGIKSFKSGMADDAVSTATPKALEHTGEEKDAARNHLNTVDHPIA